MHRIRNSVGFDPGHPFAQFSHLCTKAGDLLPQLGDFVLHLAATSELLGVRRQERRLALVADNEPVGLEVPDRFASDRDRNTELGLELRQRRQLPSLSELSGSDALTKPISHLLVGGLAGPLNHLHPSARIDLCPIVPKRDGQCQRPRTHRGT